MAGQMEVVGGGLSCLVARHEAAPTIPSRSSSMDADAYFVQPSPVLQMDMAAHPITAVSTSSQQQRHSRQHAQGQSSSTPIECTASASLTAQWKASTGDPLFRALQTMFTAAPARGVKRSVLQDWNCADSPSLKRFRYESGTTARPPSTPIPPCPPPIPRPQRAATAHAQAATAEPAPSPPQRSPPPCDAPGLTRHRPASQASRGGAWAAPGSVAQAPHGPQEPHCGAGAHSKRGHLARDDEGARKGMRLSPPSRLHCLQNRFG